MKPKNDGKKCVFPNCLNVLGKWKQKYCDVHKNWWNNKQFYSTVGDTMCKRVGHQKRIFCLRCKKTLTNTIKL